MKKLFTLLTMLVVAITSSWAQTELVNVDFSTWTVGGITNGTVRDGVQINSNGTNMEISSDKYLNMTQNAQYNRCVAIPLTDINGKISVTIVPGPDKDGSTSNNSTKFKYIFDADATTIKTNGSSFGTDTPTSATSIEFDITTDKTKGILYIGRQGSNYTKIKSIIVTTPSTGPVDPEFSLSKASIGTDETAQINVGTKTGLDGITLSDIDYSTPGIVTVTADGVVTPEAAGTTTITFNSAAVDGKYNAGSVTSENPLTITVTAPVVATPTLTAGGYFFDASKTVEIACATEGATIKYSTDNENWATYTEALNITETTTVYAKAEKEGSTTSAVASETYTKFSPSALASISDAKTWTIPTNITVELKDDGSTTPGKYDEYYTYADIAILNGNNIGTFDGTTLAFSGQYPYRNSKADGTGTAYGAQNGNLKFNTTVPGIVKVEFSNTSGSNKERWIKVNDVIGTVEGDGTTKVNDYFAVDAGDVIITHVDKDGALSAGLRVYSVEFTPATATTINLNASGYATYSKATDFMFTGATGYKMSLDEEAKTVTGTAVTGKIKAGEGILFKGTAGATVTILETTGATALEDNSLSGTTTASGTKATVPSICYTLSGDTFKKFAGATFNDNKAYIEGTKELNSLQIVFEGEGEATAVEAVAEANAEAVAPVKVIKNGKLYIGNYNVAGQQVK